MDMKETAALLCTWVFPLCVLVGCLTFFPIFGWLTHIEQQPNRWFEEGEALAIWSAPTFLLCSTGLFFSYRTKRRALAIIYGLLTVFALALVGLMGALSGVNAAKT